MSTTPGANLNQPFLDWYLMPEAYSVNLVRDYVRRFGLHPGQTVLDPFAGTGTTLVTAKLDGLNGFGIEVNPFLCFAARVKTSFECDARRLKQETTILLAEVRETLRGFEDGSTGQEVWEQMPQMPRLERWIAPASAARLLLIRATIERSDMAPAHRELALLALASTLRRCSNMKLLPHSFGSRIDRSATPVYSNFEERLQKMVQDLLWAQSIRDDGAPAWGRSEVANGDARSFDGASFDLLPADLSVTSPPYLNNLDYTMQTRLELFFLGYTADMLALRGVRKRMLICDVKATYRDIDDQDLVADLPEVQDAAAALDQKLADKNWGWDYGRMTRQYFGGLQKALASLYALLKRGARCVLVLGESAHSGVLIRVPEIAALLGARCGFNLEAIDVLRTRSSSSHRFRLQEAAVILRRA